MRDHQRSHLASTQAAVAQHLAEARQLVTTGKTPGGRRAAALPEPLRGQVLARLAAVAAALDDLTQAFAPTREAQAPEIGGAATTRMWLSILLRTTYDLVEDLQPERLGRQFGPLEASEAGTLATQSAALLAAVRGVLQLLDAPPG